MRELSHRETSLLWERIEESEKSLSPHACRNEDALREHPSKYDRDVLRTQFSIDVDKILHSPLYNRGNDKTQVFSSIATTISPGVPPMCSLFHASRGSSATRSA